MRLQRLQKILSQATDLSRRSAEAAILSGKVKVNGLVITKLPCLVDPSKAKITYLGKRAALFKDRFYVAFNKPKNTIVSKNDPQGRPLIWDYLPKEMKEGLDSAGRLDFDSEGLLILSNDGDFINRLTHPSFEVQKTYHVKVKGQAALEKVNKLVQGVKLEDGIAKAVNARIIKETDNSTWLEIILKEGRNREVRRMCSAIGFPVLKLRRTAVGSIMLGKLKPGKWRFFKRQTFRACGGSAADAVTGVFKMR